MGLAATSSAKSVKPITVRRNVERKILRFSLCIGAVCTFIAAMAYAIALRSDLRDPQTVNIEALAEMHCEGDTCDTSDFTKDPYTDSPEYVVDSQTRNLLSTPGFAPETAMRLPSLDFADPAFVRKFRQPGSYDSLDKERWRLFSRLAVLGSKNVEIIIGYAEKQPTKILEALPEDLPEIDQRLRKEADDIAANLRRMREPLNRAIKSAPTVTGPYKHVKVGGQYRHVRPVTWIRPDVPRTAFRQDLLYSFGAFMTVCNISRNDAERRIAEVLTGKEDPGPSLSANQINKKAEVTDEVDEENRDFAQAAHDQIVAHIQTKYPGHGLTKLVDAVLKADGWVTKVSPPGADGGVDILAGRGTLGLDQPRLCVQVKSQLTPADVTIYRGLQGSMQSFKAEQGLLVCWGGFNKSAHQESKQGHFTVRLWEGSDLVQAIYRNYEKLPPEIQAELPLKRVWMLVTEEVAE